MALVFAVLGLMWLYREKLTAPSEEDLNKPQLLTFKKDDVTGVDLVAAKGSTSLVKQGEAWYAEKPFHGAAVAKDADNLAQQLSELKGERTVGENQGPKDLK